MDDRPLAVHNQIFEKKLARGVGIIKSLQLLAICQSDSMAREPRRGLTSAVVLSSGSVQNGQAKMGKLTTCMKPTLNPR